jgi:hypothetical protein
LKQEGARDTQWLEEGLRRALLSDGAALLEALLNDEELQVPGDHARPGEKVHPGRPLSIHTLLGPVRVARRYYYHPDKPAGTCGRFPLDSALGLMARCTPAVVKIATRAAAQGSYEEASADLAALAGIRLCGRRLQRLTQLAGATLYQTLKRLPAPPPATVPIPVLYILADGTGIPMNKAALCGIKGRAADGTARTREVKTGCVFTQTLTDEEGRALRDEDSTTWVSGFEQAVDFGLRLRDEALRRGAAHARRTVVLGDGAAWIWELARVNFPEALQILDFWHASEYLAAITRLLHPPGSAAGTQLYERWRGEMAASRIGSILTEARAAAASFEEGSPAQVAMTKHLAYLENQRPRMDYATWRAEGLFIGSGVVEAGCKTLVGARFKRSGMFWSEPGARNLLHIRTALFSQSRFEDFWAARASA